MRALMTFWIGSPQPDVSSSSAVISTLDGLTRPLVAFAAVLGLVVGGVRMAWTARQEQSAQAVLRGLLLMTLVTAAGATLVEIALTGFDELARSILQRGFDGRSVGDRLAQLGSLPTVGGGLLFILAFFGMLASLVQVGLMLIRGAILSVLVGVLPVAAAAAITDTGYHWFKRLAGWIGSFVVYKLAAAIIYAAAFTMIGDATDLPGVVSGFSLLVVAILALPALLRLLPPAAEAMGSGSGGGMGGLVAAGATGAVLLSGTHRSPAPAATDTPGLAGRSGMTGPTGSERAGGGGGPLPLPAGGGGAGPVGGPSGSTAAAGGSGATGAAAGAGSGGAVISAAQQAHDSAKRAANGAVGDTGECVVSAGVEAKDRTYGGWRRPASPGVGPLRLIPTDRPARRDRGDAAGVDGGRAVVGHRVRGPRRCRRRGRRCSPTAAARVYAEAAAIVAVAPARRPGPARVPLGAGRGHPVERPDPAGTVGEGRGLARHRRDGPPVRVGGDPGRAAVGGGDAGRRAGRRPRRRRDHGCVGGGVG